MKQVINPIFLMNRAAHKIVQRVGLNTYVRSSGGGGIQNLVTQDPADWTPHGAAFTQGETIGGRSDVWKVDDAGSFTQIYYDNIAFESGVNYELVADVYRVGGATINAEFHYQDGAWVETSPTVAGAPTVDNAWTNFTLPFTALSTVGNVRFYSSSVNTFYVDPTTIFLKKN